jgi:hypothetical protein
MRQQADLGIQMEKGVDTPGINQEEHKSTYLVRRENQILSRYTPADAAEVRIPIFRVPDG